MADGTCVQVFQTSGRIKKLVITNTASVDTQVFLKPALEQTIEGWLMKLVTDPGATAPVDNYDITITDDEGVDVLQGVGMNRDEATTEEANIVYAGTSDHPVVSLDDTLNWNMDVGDDNDANSAVVVATLYWFCP